MTHKKALAAVWMAVLLIFSSMTVVAADPAALEAQGENLVSNGGFEEMAEEGIPAGGWHSSNGDALISLATDTVYEGEYAMRIEKEPNTDILPGWRCNITENFVPGGVYEVSAMVNYELYSGAPGDFMLLIEFYGKNANGADDSASYLGGQNGGAAISAGANSNKTWLPLSGVLQIPNETELVVFWCYMTCPGIVYVDNCVMRQTGGPEPYAYSTDQVFYYPTDTESVTRVTIDEYYKPGDAPYTATVDYALKDGDTVLKEQKNVGFTEDGCAEFKFDLSLLKEQQKEYRVYATLKNAEGETEREWQSEVYIYPWPTALDENGLYIDENGEVFYPSIAYWALPDYAKNKEVGVNVLELGATSTPETCLQMLDEVHAAGMKVLLCLWSGCPAYMQPPGHPDNQEWTAEMVEAIKDHPGIFAYSLMDEPLGGGVTEERVQHLTDGYKIIRDIDPHHPVYNLDYNAPIYPESQKYGDLWCADIYTYGDTSTITTRGELAVQAAAGRKPTYLIIQTYKSSSYGLPTIVDVRGCLYRGFEVGITGIGYYTLSVAIGQQAGDPRTDLPDTPLWEPMKAFAENEQQELFDYFAGKKYPTFNLHETGVRDFYYTSWVHGEDLWIVAHNRGNDVIQAEVPLVSDNGLAKVQSGTAKAIGGTTADLTITDGVLRTEMQPQEVYLYKLTPDTPINTEVLSIQVNKPENSGNTGGMFSDLSGYSWAQEAIESMFDAGVINETTVYSYSPAENITRGDFAMFLMRALGLRAEGEGFSDVPADAPYAKEVTAGRVLGILEGNGDGTFSPEEPVSRQDMMKIAARGMRHAGKLGESGDAAVLDTFSDKAQISDYALTDAAAMVVAGIIKGNGDGTINPLGYTTRAEAAVIVERIIGAPMVETVQKPEEDNPAEETVSIAFAEETVTEQSAEDRTAAMDVLRKLGIADFSDPEKEVTRAEAAEIVMKAMGAGMSLGPCDTAFTDVTAENPRSGYIAAAARLGIMRGTAEGIFSPDAAITYNQTLKILVDALGYSAQAEAQGGYMAGYALMANRLELAKGINVTADGAIRAGTAAKLFYNALLSPIAQRTSFGTDALTFTSDEEVTMLAKYHGLTAVRGMLSGIPSAIIDSTRLLRKGELAIDGAVYKDGGNDISAYLGQPIIAYVREETSGDRTVVFTENRTKAEERTLDVSQIVPERSTTGSLCCMDENRQEYTLRVADDAQFVLNGKAKANWSAAELDFEDGTVTLLERGSQITTILAEKYINKVVDSINENKNLLYFTDGTSMEVSDSTSGTVFLTDTDGEEIKLSACKKNNVASITESTDGTIVSIVISAKKLSGVVTETDGESITVGEIAYKLAGNLLENAPVLGENITFVLDKNGKLAFVDPDGNVTNYAYFTAMEKKKGLDETVTMRVFTREGVMEYLPLAKKVSLNGTVVSAAEVFDGNALRTLANEVRAQLIVMETNEEGEITSIETAIDITGHQMPGNFDKDAHFTKDLIATYDSLASRYTPYDQFTFGDYYHYDSNTVIFSVPSQYMDEEYYFVINQNAWTDMGRLPDSVFYDIDKDTVIGAVVSVNETSTAGKKALDTGKVAVITDVRTSLGEDGETRVGFGILDRDGLASVAYAAEEFSVILEYGTTFTSEVSAQTREKSIPVKELRPGDVIQFEENTQSGLMTACTVLMRCGQNPPESEYSTQGISQFYNYSSRTLNYGTVLEKLSTGLHIQSRFKRILAWKSRSKTVPIYLCERSADGMTATFTEITQSDILPGDKVFCATLSVWNEFFVIYR